MSTRDANEKRGKKLLLPRNGTKCTNRKNLWARDRIEGKSKAGILRWRVGGAFEWKQFKLMEPDEVKSATGAYRSDMDILGDFLAECTKAEPGSQTTSAALSRAYNKWRQKNGEHPMSARSLGMRLKERGFVQERLGHNRTRIWKDFVLIEEDTL